MRKRKTARKTARKTNPHAVALGRLGGQAKSAAKARAVRENGRLGGRPRKDGKPPIRRRKTLIARRAARARQKLETLRRVAVTPETDRASSSETPDPTPTLQHGDRASSSEPNLGPDSDTWEDRGDPPPHADVKQPPDQPKD